MQEEWPNSVERYLQEATEEVDRLRNDKGRLLEALQVFAILNPVPSTTNPIEVEFLGFGNTIDHKFVRLTHGPHILKSYFAK